LATAAAATDESWLAAASWLNVSKQSGRFHENAP
jgi:hypothetical protein